MNSPKLPSAPLLRLTNITRTYPGVTALSEVDFDLRPGEIHCLIGENGAGKSTLMRILSGAEVPSSGTIEFDNRSYDHLTPTLRHDFGIGIIYQETDLVMTLSVAQNIFLGHEPRNSYGAVDWKRMRHECQLLLNRLGLDEQPDTLVRTLSAANRQLVQIAKALSRENRVLILDEPTTALSVYETERLFDILRSLRSQGKAIVFISHRLEEVLLLGDRVTVLRDGKRVITADVEGLTQDALIQYMVGRPLGEHFGKREKSIGRVVMSVRGLTVPNHFQDISFDLHEGEILGLAGLVGAGRTALLLCLFGSVRATAGEISLWDKHVSLRSPRPAVKHGLGLVPEDRRESGLILNLSVAQNITLPVLDQLQRLLILNKGKMSQLASKFVDQLRIKTPSVSQRVRNLSGGNQQKVVLSKWLARDTRILLLDEPTRGIDVGAKAEIYSLINQMAEQGMAVLMVSSDLIEILGMSDRILVMAEGHLTKELPAAGATQEEIILYALPRVQQAGPQS